MTLLFLSEPTRRVWNAMRYAEWKRIPYDTYLVLEGRGSGWVVTVCALLDGSASTATAAFPNATLLLGMPDIFAKELLKEALRHAPLEDRPSSEAHSTTLDPQGERHET